MLPTKKSERYISTLCSNCSENYGVPEFREHILTEDMLECCMCGQKYKIVELEDKNGYYALRLISRGRRGRRETEPISTGREKGDKDRLRLILGEPQETDGSEL